MSSKEPQVLEAVTAMARIATLAFHPEGAKIAFRNHNIVICPPATDTTYRLIPKSLLQGIDRYWNSDSRGDLHIFNHVIKNFIDLYVIPHKDDEKTYNNLINLAKYTCVGLMRLQRTYADQHCNAVLVIQLYVNILRDLIRGKHDETSFYIPDGHTARRIIHTEDSRDNVLTLSTIFDIDKFKTFWSKKELNRLCDQFRGCFKNQGEVEEVIFSNTMPNTTGGEVFGLLLNASGSVSTDNETSTKSEISGDDGSEIESLMDSEALIPMPIQTQSSFPAPITTLGGSPSGHNKPINGKEFSLPEPSNQSLPIVKGLIVSIISILDAMDQRFSAVLTQSLQGVK